MIAFLSILAVGFFLGMRHATDPDHVIAVTTIVSNQRGGMRAALIGAFWGLGHTLTILVVGTGIILFNLVIPVRLGLSMELSVAVMLVVLGVMNIAAFLRSMPAASFDSEIDNPEHTNLEREAVVHSHPHQHGDFIHSHPHAHEPGRRPHPPGPTLLAWLDRALGRVGVYQYLRPLLVGIVHGLAGSAAVALLVLTTIRNSHWAIAYLLLFGVGTIAGMMLITLGIASTFRAVSKLRQNFAGKLAMASGLLSVAFGLVVAYQICVVSGLFGVHAHWTPH
jgi:ABC-type nickel/cobalt efflux system permease component RcnA